MAASSASLGSDRWSCEDLTKGALLCADLAGLELSMDPAMLSRAALLQAIQDFFRVVACVLYTICGVTLLKPLHGFYRKTEPCVSQEAKSIMKGHSQVSQALYWHAGTQTLYILDIPMQL